MRHNWPGNVRELQNVVRNVVVLNDGATVTRDMLPSPLEETLHGEKPVSFDTEEVAQLDQQAKRQDSRMSGNNQIEPLWVVEKQAIERAIDLCSGNVQKAAAYLEVSPSTLYRKLQTWKNAG